MLGLLLPRGLVVADVRRDFCAVSTSGCAQPLEVEMGAVLGGALMIAVHDITESSGKVTSYSYALVVGAVCAAAAVLTGSLVRSSSR